MTRTLSVFGAAVGMACGFAGAQQSNDPNQQHPGVIYPAPHSPIGGVPAAAPRPGIIQGVPAALPQVTPAAGVPSSGPPARTTPIVGPVHPVIPQPVGGGGGMIDDHTRSDLIRRIVAAQYGPGVSIVDGQLTLDKPKMMMTGWPAGSSTWATPVLGTGDGRFRGFYNSNDFRLGFSVGNYFPIVNYGWDTSYGKYPQRMYRSYYSPWEDWDRYRNAPCGTYYNPYLIAGADQSYVADPRLSMPSAEGVPVREFTPLEKAEYALKAGDASGAVKELKLHLKESPDDAGVERLLAMALIDDHKVEQGVAVLSHAYTKQPQLARDPIDPRMLSGGELDHRRRFGAVMDYASRAKTASSLLAASVLAQSEGRLDTAKKLLDRAVAAGLDKKVAEEMKIAMANG